MRTELSRVTRHDKVKTQISVGRRSSWRDSPFAKHLALILMLLVMVGGASCADVSLFEVIRGSDHVRAEPPAQAGTNSYTARPVYREEQLIITQPGNTTVITWQQHNYTSLFDLNFLHELLDLQNAIAEISAPYNGTSITLQDICFAPQKPANNNCTILSILSYYQNYRQNLDREIMDEYGWFVLDNYLNHFQYCAVMLNSARDRQFGNMSCLGAFGGPVLPRTILEDYTGYKYGSATGLVITFLVNNYQDPALNGPAEAWESKFEQFMTEYRKTHSNMHIVVSSGVGPSVST